MFVLCNNCHNHYDDECQSSECAGIGVAASSPTAAHSAHKIIIEATASDSHVAYTRAARQRYAGRSVTEPQRSPMTAPHATAGPSDG